MSRRATGWWTPAVVGVLALSCGHARPEEAAKPAAPETAPSAAAKPAGQPAGQPAERTAKPTSAGPSTLSGVYTNDQATRGRYVYLGTCQSCHTPQSHTGATFVHGWVGKPLSDLYRYIFERMPQNDPGTLAPEQVADVTAYLLKLNEMPVGTNELYPDADSLKNIRIEVKSK